ncbi:MAG: hypothetical protein DRZ90_13465 [Spirochaetes bacterium]|nr:MAG: hypothetical protein DRP60_05450 [Spirochaetota bacterium]RKX92820.1 MAG: hypothetical protein DRZ90_13465 [Spirochaetota bacterium]
MPSEAGKPGLLKEGGITPIRGKIIRLARALLVTVRSEGSDRKYTVHSESEPDTAWIKGNLAKSGNAQYLIRLSV